jgi:hypothetical protein
VTGNHAATKDDMDATVAIAAGTASSGGAACYYTNTNNCGVGFELQPGLSSNGQWTNLHICCTRPGGSASATGFFVLTESQWNGDLGRLEGANQKCLSELVSKPWLGKNVTSLGKDNVRAFLCDNAIC